MQLDIDSVPILVGPVSYLLLSKSAKGVKKNFSLFTLLDKIVPIYKYVQCCLAFQHFVFGSCLIFSCPFVMLDYFCREVIGELKAAGASWIQLDEPTLVKDLDAHQLQAFTQAYSELESSLSGINAVVETYFADLPAEAYKTVTGLMGISGI